ncbi:hypothetical protein CU098_007390 [Rhizopus stolonifer]|uniref:WW domain-containing protein n=1 Tax=Rhizopus stolonifer TaxID=4846 RepID=A0A367IRE0_RHIST|nr:hypothetical protein CU098_007390 [Rhizopus stolonifer]
MGLFSKHKKSPTLSYQSGPPPYHNYAPPSPPQQHTNPDSRPLPNGWISQFDANSNRFFYVYTPTALRQWEHPADKPLNSRGENASYNQQRPYYQQQQQQQYVQQPQYIQPQQAQYTQQPVMGRTGRFGGGGGMGGFGTMAAAGLGGGLLGYMVGDAVGDSHPDIIENNYYGDDFNGGGGFDNGGFDDGGGNFEMF